MENKLILNTFEVGGRQEVVKLVATADGCVLLTTPESQHQLTFLAIEDIMDEGFLTLNVAEGCSRTMLYPLKDSQYADVADYLKYWDGGGLEDLKKEKLGSFLNHFKTILEFTKNNIDVDRFKPQYKTEYIDNRDYGGGAGVWIDIELSYGISWEDDYDRTRQLTEELTDILIDQHMGSEHQWLGDIVVNFSPKAKNIADFVPKVGLIPLEAWEQDCLVPLSNFIASINCGMGTEGSGYYSDGKNRTTTPVNLSRIESNFSHIVWYDK